MAVVTSARTASAQDAGKVGISMAFPTSVGVHFQIAERFAIRPDVSATWTSTDISLGSGLLPDSYTNESTHLEFGVSVLIGVARWDDLRAYVAPRVAYRRSTSISPSFSYSPVPPYSTTEEEETTSTGYDAGAMFGARYSLGDRFAVFAEAGASYYSLKTPRDSGTDRSRAFSTTGGVGAILFF
jgi:hypothetical protein